MIFLYLLVRIYFSRNLSEIRCAYNDEFITNSDSQLTHSSDDFSDSLPSSTPFGPTRKESSTSSDETNDEEGVCYRFKPQIQRQSTYNISKQQSDIGPQSNEVQDNRPSNLIASSNSNSENTAQSLPTHVQDAVKDPLKTFVDAITTIKEIITKISLKTTDSLRAEQHSQMNFSRSQTYCNKNNISSMTQTEPHATRNIKLSTTEENPLKGIATKHTNVPECRSQQHDSKVLNPTIQHDNSSKDCNKENPLCDITSSASAIHFEVNPTTDHVYSAVRPATNQSSISNSVALQIAVLLLGLQVRQSEILFENLQNSEIVTKKLLHLIFEQLASDYPEYKTLFNKWLTSTRVKNPKHAPLSDTFNVEEQNEPFSSDSTVRQKNKEIPVKSNSKIQTHPMSSSSQKNTVADQKLTNDTRSGKTEAINLTNESCSEHRKLTASGRSNQGKANKTLSSHHIRRTSKNHSRGELFTIDDPAQEQQVKSHPKIDVVCASLYPKIHYESVTDPSRDTANSSNKHKLPQQLQDPSNSKSNALFDPLLTHSKQEKQFLESVHDRNDKINISQVKSTSQNLNRSKNEHRREVVSQSDNEQKNTDTLNQKLGVAASPVPYERETQTTSPSPEFKKDLSGQNVPPVANTASATTDKLYEYVETETIHQKEMQVSKRPSVTSSESTIQDSTEIQESSDTIYHSLDESQEEHIIQNNSRVQPDALSPNAPFYPPASKTSQSSPHYPPLNRFPIEAVQKTWTNKLSQHLLSHVMNKPPLLSNSENLESSTSPNVDVPNVLIHAVVYKKYDKGCIETPTNGSHTVTPEGRINKNDNIPQSSGENATSKPNILITLYKKKGQLNLSSQQKSEVINENTSSNEHSLSECLSKSQAPDVIAHSDEEIPPHQQNSTSTPYLYQYDTQPVLPPTYQIISENSVPRTEEDISSSTTRDGPSFLQRGFPNNGSIQKNDNIYYYIPSSQEARYDEHNSHYVSMAPPIQQTPTDEINCNQIDTQEAKISNLTAKPNLRPDTFAFPFANTLRTTPQRFCGTESLQPQPISQSQEETSEFPQTLSSANQDLTTSCNQQPDPSTPTSINQSSETPQFVHATSSHHHQRFSIVPPTYSFLQPYSYQTPSQSQSHYQGPSDYYSNQQNILKRPDKTTFPHSQMTDTSNSEIYRDNAPFKCRFCSCSFSFKDTSTELIPDELHTPQRRVASTFNCMPHAHHYHP